MPDPCIHARVARQLADLRPLIVREGDDFAIGVLSALNAAARSISCIFAGEDLDFDREAFLKSCGLPTDRS